MVLILILNHQASVISSDMFSSHSLGYLPLVCNWGCLYPYIYVSLLDTTNLSISIFQIGRVYIESTLGAHACPHLIRCEALTWISPLSHACESSVSSICAAKEGCNYHISRILMFSGILECKNLVYQASYKFCCLKAFFSMVTGHWFEILCPWRILWQERMSS